ncbi:hypothetical protein DXG01_005025 [Tephrocybe rancida]|nr:hypothetical protein DXG01_005025 [Tephrocybe rancida]
MVCNIPVVVTSLIAFRREVRMANASKPSGVQFASWGFRHSTGAQPSNAQGGTTTTGWTNSLFRWERNIQDTEIGTTMTTTDLSKTVDLNACIELSELPNKPSTNGVQIDHEVYVEVDETQKNAWRSQDN